MTYATTGYQWFCGDSKCDAGSHGGMDGSRPDIRLRMENAARQHHRESGHETVVERMQRSTFGENKSEPNLAKALKFLLPEEK